MSSVRGKSGSFGIAACSRGRANPGTVADRFVDKYYVEAEESFTIGKQTPGRCIKLN